MPVYDNGLPRPLRRYGRVDTGHVQYWFGRHCDSHNLISHRVPILGRVYVHRRVAEAYERVFTDIAEAGDAGLIDLKDYGGTYCCRRVRGGHSYSPHSWGIAIDLNIHHFASAHGETLRPDTNWRCRASEIAPSLRKLAAHFHRWGFTWGGDWQSFKDPMHYEATELTVRLLEGGPLPEEFVRACRQQQSGSSGHYYPGPVKVVLLPEGTVVQCDARFDGDGTRCNLRPLAEALGAEVVDHIPDQRKVYLRRRQG
ncbi:MAG: M15 family metallopeptidase [Armatimonadetes bacterium]|nr:M15 family metallopeptidase [Armatimonadota bacterium]